MEPNIPPSSGASIPNTVGDLEELGHEIFTSGEKRRAARGEVPHSVFHERIKTEISVDRLAYAPEQFAVALGDQRAAALGSNRSFYGWVAIAASDAADSGRKVTASPPRDGSNPYHADIELPEIVNVCNAKHEFHTLELADRAYWKSRP